MRRFTTFATVLILLVTVSTAAAQDPFEAFVYVDRDTLTLHVPGSGVISLEGIGFQVPLPDINGKRDGLRSKQGEGDKTNIRMLPRRCSMIRLSFKLLDNSDMLRAGILVIGLTL